MWDNRLKLVQYIVGSAAKMGIQYHSNTTPMLDGNENDL